MQYKNTKISFYIDDFSTNLKKSKTFKTEYLCDCNVYKSSIKDAKIANMKIDNIISLKKSSINIFR